jgi:hypothetical protein
MRRLPIGETLGVPVIGQLVPCGGCFAAGAKDDFSKGLLDLSATGAAIVRNAPAKETGRSAGKTTAASIIVAREWRNWQTRWI